MELIPMEVQIGESRASLLSNPDLSCDYYSKNDKWRNVYVKEL